MTFVVVTVFMSFNCGRIFRGRLIESFRGVFFEENNGY